MPPVDPAAVRRKVWWRIVPLLFILYIVAYLDRANLGFAKNAEEVARADLDEQEIGLGLAGS